jgi:hypothetical protein
VDASSETAEREMAVLFLASMLAVIAAVLLVALPNWV